MDVTLASDDTFDGARIGLLGGSFNPAHDGHLQMSLFALERLKLDAVWWLVSPGNPLKKTQEMTAFSERLTNAKKYLEAQPKIIATGIENELGTRYTIDTLRALQMRYAQSHFVWLMGADNLQTFHLWRSWEAIMREVPIAVFKRSGYLDSGERGLAAATFATAEVPLTAVEDLAVTRPPAWAVLDNVLNPLSATQIRATKPTYLKRSSHHGC